MENKASVLRKQSRRIRFLWKSWWLGEEFQRSLQLRKMFSLKNPLVFLKGAAIPVLCMLCYLSRPEQGSHDRPLSSTQMTALYCQRWMSLTAHHIIPGISITCSIASRRLSSAILNKNALFLCIFKAIKKCYASLSWIPLSPRSKLGIHSQVGEMH